MNALPSHRRLLRALPSPSNLRVDFLALVAMTAACTIGCSIHAKEPSAADGAGTVRLELQTSSGLTLQAIQYSIVGPDFQKTGSIDLSGAATLSAVLSGIPKGGVYTLTLTSSSTDGTATCHGSTTFSVTAGATTKVIVPLDCNEAPRTGSIGINGVINTCPVIDGVDATPSEVTVGHTIMLAATAEDPDDAPRPLSYQWSAPAGTLSDPSVRSPTFSCPSVGSFPVTVTVSDGDGQPGCAPSQTVVLSCVAASSTGGAPGDDQGGRCIFHADSVVFNTDAHGTASALRGPLTMTWSQSDNRFVSFQFDTLQLVTENPFFNQIAPTDERQVFWDYAVTVGPTTVNDPFARNIRGYVSNQDSAGSCLGSFSGLFEGASAQFWMGAQGTLDCDFGLSSGIHITGVAPSDGSRVNVDTCGPSTTHLTVAFRDGRQNEVAVTQTFDWTATFYAADGVTPLRADVPIGSGTDVAWTPSLGGQGGNHLDPNCQTGTGASPTDGQKISITVTAHDSTGCTRARTIIVYALCTPC